MRSQRWRGTPLLAALAGVLVTLALTGAGLGQRADGTDSERCARFHFQSAARERVITGRGTPVAVLGDSYAVGLGLADPSSSWPARLDGRTTVLGFSGSGFAADSSPCRGAAYVDRVRRAAGTARTVVVEGGLNDVDQSDAAIRSGVRTVLAALRDRQVLVVGPTRAPARAGQVARVDRLLASECARAGVAYLSVRSLELPYLADRLHLTRAGHRLFGETVAARLAELS